MLIIDWSITLCDALCIRDYTNASRITKYFTHYARCHKIVHALDTLEYFIASYNESFSDLRRPVPTRTNRCIPIWDVTNVP